MSIIKKITTLGFIIGFTTLFLIIPFWVIGKYVELPEGELTIKTVIFVALYTSTLLLAFAFRNYVINIISILVFFASCIIQLLEYMSFATMNTTFNLAFYMTLTDINTLINDGKHFWLTGLFIIIYFLSSFALLVIICIKAKSFSPNGNNNSSQKLKVCALCCALVSVIAIFTTCSPHKNFFNMFKEANNANTIDISDMRLTDNKKYGIKASKIKHHNLITNHTKKNLVFIIMESTEKNFLDQDLFPGLLPNLTSYFSDPQTAAFTNITSTASNTTCSMFETFFAINETPLIIGSNQGIRLGAATNSSNLHLMSRLISFPAIYQKAGGSWMHIQGSSMWSAMYNIATAAKINHSTWRTEVTKPIPRRELRDHEIFNYAWEIFKIQSAKQKPFAISISTIDAHAPNGRIDDKTITFSKTPPDFPNNRQQLLNAMHTTDHYLGKFITNLQKHPAYKDTVIVIMSDHLTMANLGGYLSKKKNRQLLFMIMNSKHKGFFNVPGFTFDIAPTVLDALGIKSNYTFAVGENLFSVEKLNTQRKQVLSADGKAQLAKSLIWQTTDNNESHSNIYFKNNNHRLTLHFGNTLIPVDFYGPVIPYNDDIMIVTTDSNQTVTKNEYYRSFLTKKFNELKTNDSAKYIIFCSTHSQWFKKLYNSSNVIPVNAQYALAYGNCQTGWNWSLAPTPTALEPIDWHTKKQEVKMALTESDYILLDKPEYFFPQSANKKNDNIVLNGSITTTLKPRIKITRNNIFEITGKLSVKNQSASIYIFPEIYDKNDKKLSPESILYIPDTEFYVLKDHKKGASELHIVPIGDHIKKSKRISQIALYTKPDFSDLPNKNTLPVKDTKRLHDGSIIFTLRAPLKSDIGKNVQGRIHIGSYFYRAINTGISPNQEKKQLYFTENLEYYTKIPNAEYIRVCIALHPKGKNKQLAEFTLTDFRFGNKKHLQLHP